MPIPLTSDQRAALESGVVAVRTLVDFHLDSGRYSFWDGEFNADFGGQTYIAASDFGEISAITMGIDLGAEGVEIRLNGTKLLEESPDAGDPGALFGTLESENYQLRRVDIRFAFLEPETGALILLVRRYAGLIDQVRQVEEIGADGAIRSLLIVSLESVARRYGVRTGRTRSNDDQQEIWPGDTFFKFTASAVAKVGSIPWGRATSRAVGGNMAPGSGSGGLGVARLDQF